MITIKKTDDIIRLKAGGHILAQILAECAKLVEPGVSTAELNNAVERLMKEADVQPAFLGYRGYPASLCTSVNSRVVHGIPSAQEKLKAGDVIGLDVGLIYQERYVDMAVTVPVGQISERNRRLIQITEEALGRGIDALKPGVRLGAVGAAIQATAERQGFGVVRALSGHGVGYALHEDPAVPNIGPADSGPIVKPGMVLAIEPMITEGDWRVRTLADGWAVETVDGSTCAHFEHTVVVTDQGAEICTLMPDR